MGNELFTYSSQRSFVIFSYNAGHGPLLLRSRKTDAHSTRLDILIMDVRALELRCWFDGVRIEETDKEYLVRFASNPEEMMEHGNRVYAVSGKNWAGFVVGGIISTYEDNEEYGTESALLKEPSL